MRGASWPWIAHLNFERTIANFFAVSEKNNIKEVFYVRIMHITALYIDGLKIREQFLVRVTQKTFPRNYFKISQAVSEENTFLRISSCL